LLATLRLWVGDEVAVDNEVGHDRLLKKAVEEQSTPASHRAMFVERSHVRRGLPPARGECCFELVVHRVIVQTLAVATVEVLVSVQTDDGLAGVLRDEDGAMWLSWRTDSLGGPRLDDFRPDHLGLPDDRTLIGGRLPLGAVGAEAVDDAGRRITAVAGGGAWIAVLDQPILGPRAPAWCWDPSGAPVAPELPADWPRTRIADANEPCPACGRTVWDEVTPTDDSRGMRNMPGTNPPRRPPTHDHYAGMEPTPFVVCCACGHEESIGAMIRFTRRSDEDDAEKKRRVREAQQRIRDDQRQTLATVQFEVFTDQGWPASMSGSGASDDVVDSVTVQHGTRADQPGPTLRIETAQNDRYRDSEYAQARAELDHWLHSEISDLPTDRSDASLTVAWRRRDRERRQRAATATRGEVQLRVDGAVESFCYLRSGDYWVAVHERTSQTLTIAAQHVDPASLDLRPLRDPIAELSWDDLF
jgi:hypothetical protein